MRTPPVIGFEYSCRDYQKYINRIEIKFMIELVFMKVTVWVEDSDRMNGSKLELRPVN